ncbi:hypothetical protein Clacol_005463 [Clathrus columnatus]|uniref:Uncharacterized protein n=1 Tax=Clathrus columnatus TaxID=1419009 RepID=A0AAV5AE32_9AGAM|nr:hypothetical protein Clacol_005463 [Clathrus columnatus]
MEDYRNTHLHVLKSYELLATHIPDFNELIQETNPEKTHALTDELKRGQDNAFQSDMNRLKIAIIEMIAQTYPETQVRNTLSPHEKKMRGFVDEAYKAIFTGPSSWDSVSGETHMYKKCNARLANMHEVTTCSIAYIAVQVCAALSLVEHNFKFSAVFDLLKFYWNIVEYLDEPDAEDEVRDLLDWWNFQIFPDCKKTTTVFQSQEMDSLALLKAQRAAKRRVRADAESELEI